MGTTTAVDFSGLITAVTTAANGLVDLVSQVAVPVLTVAVAIAGLSLAIRLVRKAG